MHIWLILVTLLLETGKYGKNEINKKFGKNTQELCAYKLVFDFKTDSGFLDYLRNKTIEI